jgi:hypothetical protein
MRQVDHHFVLGVRILRQYGLPSIVARGDHYPVTNPGLEEEKPGPVVILNVEQVRNALFVLALERQQERLGVLSHCIYIDQFVVVETEQHQIVDALRE